jgi:HD-GYP domain-containing protein (c-di-GMP phosphodiesterase class II)
MLDKHHYVRLFDMMMALSTATDMISPAVANHGKRVAYIAFSLAEAAGLPLPEQQEILLAGIVHDIGALALKERLDLLEFEAVDPGSHAELGYLFLSRSSLLSNIALIVRYHHQQWKGGEGALAAGEPVPLGSHILHLADRIDTAVFRNPQPLGQVEEIVARITARRETMFMPRLVDVFEQLARREYFWLDIVSPVPDSSLCKIMQSTSAELDQAALLSLAILFSHIIDFKSSFTSTHSAGVASSAEALARLAGFSENECQMMLIAGYLHDLGKLAVPSELLDKPAALSQQEYGVIRSHTFYTRRILESIPQLETITDWAASHHERLDGEGYPYHSLSQELSLGARIVAVADVFTALAETRPYREGLHPQEVLATMEGMAAAGKLDRTVFELLQLHFAVVNAQRDSAQRLAQEDYLATLKALGL